MLSNIIKNNIDELEALYEIKGNDSDFEKKEIYEGLLSKIEDYEFLIKKMIQNSKTLIILAEEKLK